MVIVRGESSECFSAEIVILAFRDRCDISGTLNSRVRFAGDNRRRAMIRNEDLLVCGSLRRRQVRENFSLRSIVPRPALSGTIKTLVCIRYHAPFASRIMPREEVPPYRSFNNHCLYPETPFVSRRISYLSYAARCCHKNILSGIYGVADFARCIIPLYACIISYSIRRNSAKEMVVKFDKKVLKV